MTDPQKLIFGKYELIRRLALGGMGEVFLARQTGGVSGTERLVILKSLLPELAEQDGFIDQFLDEARVAAKLNHPNIVQMFEAGLWNGVYFIAMEYIRGENLSRIAKIARQRSIEMPLHVVTRVVRDALLGLSHAHTAHDEITGQPLGVVHRDVSPQNIMVRVDGVTKVVDFGIAKAGNRSSRTATGVLKGKLQYMAPEQVRGDSLDARTDQFAMGVVLWELATGRKLFGGDNEIEMLRAVLTQPIPAPSSLIAGFPPDLEATIMRMLERDSARRFSSCEEAADQLTAWLNQGSRRVSEADVAAWLKPVVGSAVEETTRNLTPSGDNFLLGLHGAHAGHVTTLPPMQPSHETSPTIVRRENRRNTGVAMIFGGVAALLLLGGVGVVMMNGANEEAPPRPVVVDKAPPAPAPRLAARPVVVRDGHAELAIDEPRDARIVVDDVDRPERVPTVLHDLSLDRHRVVVIANDGTRFDVPFALPPPRITIVTDPPGASISADGAPLGLSPLETDKVPSGNHELLVKLDGYKWVKETVSTLRDGEVRAFSWKLEKGRLAAGPAPNGGASSGGASGGASGAASTGSSGGTTSGTTTAATSKPAECFGSLTINTTPWSKVMIDGDPYGTTPLLVRKIRGGPHQVVFENEAEKLRVTKTVTAVCDDAVKVNLPLK